MNPALLALLGPLLTEGFNLLMSQVVEPELQKLECKIGSEEVKNLVQSVSAAVEKFIAAEIPKI